MSQVVQIKEVAVSSANLQATGALSASELQFPCNVQIVRCGIYKIANTDSDAAYTVLIDKRVTPASDTGGTLNVAQFAIATGDWTIGKVVMGEVSKACTLEAGDVLVMNVSATASGNTEESFTFFADFIRLSENASNQTDAV
jgi:hypothetical protein